jgi:hypothetical protein
MSSEYRFLRFEVVGIATIIFLLVGIAPLIDKDWLTTNFANTETSIAAVGALFLISLPLGYWEHQLVVNVYRSHKKERRVFKILKDIVLEIEKKQSTSAKKPFFESLDEKMKNAFLTSLLDIYVYANPSVSPEIFGRLSDRWSHFYARRAVGVYAPIISLLFWIVAVILGFLTKLPLIFQLDRFAVSIAWWVVIFILSKVLIDLYAQKLWEEISFLEESIVLANRKKAEESATAIISSMMEYPAYHQKDDSYGRAIFKI